MSKRYSKKDLKNKIKPVPLVVPTAHICEMTDHVLYESKIIIDEVANEEFEKLPEYIKRAHYSMMKRAMDNAQVEICRQTLKEAIDKNGTKENDH